VKLEDRTIAEYLQMVNDQALNMIPFEQTALDRIAAFDSALQRACQFQTLLIVQPATDMQSSSLGKWRSGEHAYAFDTYSLIVEISINQGALKSTATFDSRILQPWVVQGILRRMEHVLSQLVTLDRARHLKDIRILTAEDSDKIWTWNSIAPCRVDRLLRDTIEENARQRPDAPALCGWDGDLTYSALDRLSSILAAKLSILGVTSNVFMPLLFEKSIWNIVALYAAMKAGGAFVFLDPLVSEQRLQGVMS
jgi:hypothetical protein